MQRQALYAGGGWEYRRPVRLTRNHRPNPARESGFSKRKRCSVKLSLSTPHLERGPVPNTNRSTINIGQVGLWAGCPSRVNGRWNKNSTSLGERRLGPKDEEDMHPWKSVSQHMGSIAGSALSEKTSLFKREKDGIPTHLEPRRDPAPQLGKGVL